MQNSRPPNIHQNFVFSFINLFAIALIFFCFLLLLIPSCTIKMSVEEAKQVTVSIIWQSFVPPPRRIDDIIIMLDQHHDPRSYIAKELESKLNQPLPKSKNPSTLASYYYQRGKAAMYLGRSRQALKDLRLALDYINQTTGQNLELIERIALTELSFGNYKTAIEFFERSLSLTESTASYDGLVKIHARLGNLEMAEKYKNRGVLRCKQLRQRRDAEPWPTMAENRMRAYILEARGRFAEAENCHRRVLKSNTRSFRLKHVLIDIAARQSLISNLNHQGRILECEVVARENLKYVLNLTGSESAFTGHCISDLANILFRQGRLDDAEKLLWIAIRTLEGAGVFSESYMMVETKIRLGEVLAAKGKYDQAAIQFDIIKSGLQDNRFLYEKYFARNPAIMHTLLKTGRWSEAILQIDTVFEKNLSAYGQDHLLTKEIMSLRGMAHALQDNHQAALAEFLDSIPDLLQTRSAETFDYALHFRLKSITECYMKLLVHWSEKDLGQVAEMNPVAEAFELADAIIGRTVESAIVANSARTAACDAELAELIRNEQDAGQQIRVLQIALAENLAISKEQQLPGVVADLHQKLAALMKARATLQVEIKARFPKYIQFTAPDPVTIATVQQYLRSSEAFVFIYPASDFIYIWAFSQNGNHAFASIGIERHELQSMIEKLRLSLDPNPTTLGGIPAFDLALAHRLYNEILQPVAPVWQDAEHLLIVATGPLAQLPFAVLPTTPISAAKSEVLFFDQYRKIHWLIRKVSVARLPSASTFVSLRSIPKGDSGRKVFAGFGDPFFNPQQLAEAQKEKEKPSGQKGQIHVRGIRVSKDGTLDNDEIVSCTIDRLNRLPDTSEEIKHIAQVLGADPVNDVFLGRQASEHRVKSMNLSDRRVIAFATHALVPGDLDGLDQPALALSAPLISGDHEDGLLTMGEIMTLKLNSDWVVLSACNTGAAEGKGAEAISGLGRAFFYAGTRSILVSMWPVETTSARKLTIGLFEFQKNNPGLPRAEALRQSMLQLIDCPGIIDNVSGKIVASYAHPIFWAPFIVVGEGSAN